LAQQRDIQWPETVQEHRLNLKLPRGVLISGTVIEEPDNRPLANATVRYAHRIDNSNTNDIPLVGIFQPTVLTDERGRFTLAVPPGAGHLTVDPVGDGHAVEELEEEILSGRNRPGGPRLKVIAHLEIDFQADSREHPVRLKARRKGPAS
jgi:hypothetical protein